MSSHPEAYDVRQVELDRLKADNLKLKKELDHARDELQQAKARLHAWAGHGSANADFIKAAERLRDFLRGLVEKDLGNPPSLSTIMAKQLIDRMDAAQRSTS